MHFKTRTYLQSVFWLLLSIFSSSFNDVLTKYLTAELTAYQVCFFRFACGSLVLVPIFYYSGSNSFKTKRIALHFFRGLFLSIAMGLYAYGLPQVEMSTVTIIGFTNPIFVLILASVFLKEQVTRPIWMATFLVFIGISCIFCPTIGGDKCYFFACLFAIVVFALLDIINKKYITSEPILSMLFFSNLFAALSICPVACYYWKIPTLSQFFLLSILGIGSNLILYCLLRAFKLSDAASLAPIRYIELLFSSLFGYLFFKEWPSCTTFLGAGIIISATCFIIYYQNR